MMRRMVIAVAFVVALGAGLAWHPGSYAQTTTASPQKPATAARFEFEGNAAELPAKYVGNLIFVPAHVNRSQPSLFVLDTTAPISSIDPKRAAELEIASTQAAVLNLSGVNILLPSFAQIPGNNFGARVGWGYEGTIGNDVFSSVVMELDYGRQSVRMYDPAAYKYSGAAKGLPLTFHDGMPLLRAKFSAGGKNSGEALFILNTTLDASLIVSDKFAQAHHLLRSHLKTIPVAPGELGIGGNAVIARLEDIQIGPYKLQGPLAAFAQGPLPGDDNPQIAGEIGVGIFRRFTVILDYVRQTVILDPNSEFRSDDREDMSGISLVASGSNWKTFEVTQVRPGTPGSDAGVQKGDVIEAVDEDAAADLSLDIVRKLFRQVGHKYKLLIERNGKTLTLTLEMRRLL